MDSGTGESLGGVSETALGAAEMRAEERLRPDPLFDDPYAAAFVAAAPPLFPDVPTTANQDALAALIAESVAEIAVRTRFFDDCALAAAAAGCHQVVLLGAGLDTRAFRLDWPPGARVFELDVPELFAFKERVLAQENATPVCPRTILPVDLRANWPEELTAAGFDPNARSAWLAEGLLAYLANDDAVRLFGAVGDLSAPGSQLSCEYEESASDSPLGGVRATPGMETVTSMWEGGLSGSEPEWLREHGWDVATHARPTLATRYRRRLSDSSTSGYLVAERHGDDRARRFSAS
jgi:methyltransferase (TIGR00027 family)